MSDADVLQTVSPSAKTAPQFAGGAQWLNVSQLAELIASGQLRDGISLAALAVVKTWLARSGTCRQLSPSR